MRRCRVQITLLFTVWTVCIGPPITSSDIYMMSSASTIPAIHNNLFRYGMYCGPGPDDKLWPVTLPVDSIDQTCQYHDKAYRNCLQNLSKDTGFTMPKILHQIMPIRGLVPSIITRAIFSIAPKYMSCMHHADKNLVSNFDHHVESELLPKWWSNPMEAPIGTQGITGYSEACAFGMNGICIVPSKVLFKLMLELFRRSVDSDHVPGIKGPGSGIKSPESGGNVDVFDASYYARFATASQHFTFEELSFSSNFLLIYIIF